MIIPYHMINKGDRVLFYGAGNNFRWCYEKLIKTGYCSLSGIIDKNPNEKQFDKHKVQNIDTISCFEFDYILITIVDKKIVEQVKEQLCNMNISKEKILSCYEFEEDIKIEDLQNVAEMRKYLEERYARVKFCAKNAEEYYPRLVSLFENYKDKDELLYRLKFLLSGLESNEATFILLNWMYQYNMFDKECMRLYLKCMKDVTWMDDTYYGMLIDTTVMIHFYPQFIYDTFFEDRRTIFEKICEHYELNKIKIVNKEFVEDKRVAFIVRRYTPMAKNDAPAKIAQKYALEFAKMGYKIKIFVLCSEIKPEEKEVFLRRIYGEDSWNQCTITEDDTFKGVPVQIEVSNDIDTKKRLQGTIKRIMEFQPEFILDMADECFPEASALIKYFPIINFPMRIKAYSSVADLYIAGDVEAVIEDNKIHNMIVFEKLRKVVLANLSLDETSNVIYEREKFGWNRDDFIIVTVGARLNYDIDDELLEYMYCILENEKNFKWLLVGDFLEGKGEKFDSFVRKKKIIPWGYEHNLESLYKICDVFLNPKRDGGGVSIRLAMKQGVPIATLDSSSGVKARMSSDLLVHGGYQELMQYIMNLYKDKELYNVVSMKTRKVIDDLLKDSDSQKVLRICQEAVSIRKKEGE